MKKMRIALSCSLLLLGHAAWAAETPKKLVKVSAAEAAGPIFRNPKLAQKDPKNQTVNVALLASADKKFVTGMYESGASELKVDSYPVDEYCFLISGSVKLTSADGSEMDLKSGDALVIPKGWKGVWSSSGYTKYYVIYDSPPVGK